MHKMTGESFTELLAKNLRSFLPLSLWFYILSVVNIWDFFPDSVLYASPQFPHAIERDVNLFMSVFKFIADPFISLLSTALIFIPVFIIYENSGLKNGIRNGIRILMRHGAAFIQLILISLPIFIFFDFMEFMNIKWISTNENPAIDKLLYLFNNIILDSLILFLGLITSLTLFSFWWNHNNDRILEKKVETSPRGHLITT